MNAIKQILAERELTSEGPRSKGQASRRSRSVTVNLAESPLGWLHARGHLDDRLFAAAECLRRDYERSGIAPAVTMSWQPLRSSSTAPVHPTERQIAAKDRFDGAIAAAGAGLADVLWRVVCAGESLAMAEKGLDWPARSGKLVLRLALDRVAGFYAIR